MTSEFVFHFVFFFFLTARMRQRKVFRLLSGVKHFAEFQCEIARQPAHNPAHKHVHFRNYTDLQKRAIAFVIN